MHRRLLLASAASALVLPGCGHPFRHVSINLAQGSKIGFLTVYYDAEYARQFLQPVPGFETFTAPRFAELFVSTTDELLAHNGLPARATAAPPLQRPAYLLRLRPREAIALQRGVPNSISLGAELFAGSEEPVGSWELPLSAVFPSQPEDRRWLAVERSIAQYLLLTLALLQAKALVQLKFTPPQTMAGATNAHFGKLR